MNAYELADDVKNISNTIEALEWVQKASPLLRQQADRIAELESNPRELSDEEIKEVIRKHWNRELGNRGMLALCKAVLEKASTKCG